MKFLHLVGAIMICCLLSCQFVFCQELVTDRPDQTESPIIVPRGSFQFETGPILSNSSNEVNLTLFTNLYRYAVSENFEFRLAHDLTLSNINKSSNDAIRYDFSDITFGGKYRFINSSIKAAVLGYVVIPSGSESATISKAGFISKLAVSHDFSESVGIGYNIGYDYPGGGKGNFSFSASLGINLTEEVGLFTELYGVMPEFEGTDISYDNGFTYLIKENLQADFSFGTGISSRNNFISAGISWRLPK